MSQGNRRALKQLIFERDGWCEKGEDGSARWLAECSFECGDVLDFRHATIDRFPVPGREGGRYILSNVRLACNPCNSEEGGNYNREGGVQGYIPPMRRELRDFVRKEKRDELYQKAVKNVKNVVVEGKSNDHGVRMDL